MKTIHVAVKRLSDQALLAGIAEDDSSSVRKAAVGRLTDQVKPAEPAVDYLNSGHPDLALAGQEWAGSHGYNVSKDKGSIRVTWGEQQGSKLDRDKKK